MTRFNLDDVVVVNLRPLPSGDVEALLRVSDRDYKRLVANHSAMSYVIAGESPRHADDEQ